jgi:hypothetical protein
MKECLIVDGYNIIFARPQFEELRTEDLELARHRLIDLLVNYAALTGIQIIIVFDAYKAKDFSTRREEIQSLQVIYTSSGETADSLIEKLVGELSRQSNVYVVTSDWAEQRMILGQGAYRLTPKELLGNIRRAAKEAERHYTTELPADTYLENRLKEEIRNPLEKWRRKKT